MDCGWQVFSLISLQGLLRRLHDVARCQRAVVYQNVDKGKLWTAEWRKRHDLQDSDACVFCAPEVETSDHLFTGCVQTRELWCSLLAPAGLLALAPDHTQSAAVWWLGQRALLERAARPSFDSLVLLISWIIWKERNDRTFARSAAGASELRLRTIQEADYWLRAGFHSLVFFIVTWSHNYVVM
jgi:hypothetical protein